MSSKKLGWIEANAVLNDGSFATGSGDFSGYNRAQTRTISTYASGIQPRAIW